MTSEHPPYCSFDTRFWQFLCIDNAFMDYLSSPRPSVTVVGALAAFYIVYLIGLVVYRLYFSPLAKFPGPKLAASSKWYEFYYDVVLKGQFTFQIQRMHKKYGTCHSLTSHSEALIYLPCPTVL